MSSNAITTGLPGLDQVLTGLLPGDNIVWRVDSIDDYRDFVAPCCAAARASGKKIIYFRFGHHESVVPADCGAEVYELHPEAGFENFISEIHQVVEEAGKDAVHIFDGLSDLAVDWSSDLMLGNFFMLTCPFVLHIGSLAYFAIFKNYHSLHATEPISETTQILLDVYRHDKGLYVHPIKVEFRESPTMHMLHAWEDDAFRPVTESSTIAEILTSIPWNGSELTRARLGIWTRTFMQAEEAIDPSDHDECFLPAAKELIRRLLRMLISRDERVLDMAEIHLNLADILTVWKRTIGTGLIGGKAVGMLLARAILRQSDARWDEVLETHDSFYVGSDVFYTYLVRNKCWWIREKQRNPETFLEGAEEARQRILEGTFPEDIRQQFSAILEYFGQCPIIVRSSSLQEDAFGNAFSGKYESVFCPNQGSHEKRLEEFLAAVRTVYASTMSEKALRYRARRGILDRDEQMSLLVQRVSGARYGDLYYPQIAGVGLSYNPYVWDEQIDPKSGLLRLVFGLGTRAVDRSDDDYTRLVALNAPDRRPEGNRQEVRHYAQRKVDVLNLTDNSLTSSDFVDVARQSPHLPLQILATQDRELVQLAAETRRRDIFPWVLTFEHLLARTEFVQDMQTMLGTLEGIYGCPVDTEFTANFSPDGQYKINLVQCRPLQLSDGGATGKVPATLKGQDIMFEAQGTVIGTSRHIGIDRLIYVVPAKYGALPNQDRYAVARLIGRLVHLAEPNRAEKIMLMGPGRWGTTTPSLGVPVSFGEINRVAAICEIVAMREGLVPDVSLGTHFFNDLVETDILYLALFPERKSDRINEDALRALPNRLAKLVPEAADQADVVYVVDAADLPDEALLRLHADILEQQVVCYRERQPAGKHA